MRQKVTDAQRTKWKALSEKQKVSAFYEAETTESWKAVTERLGIARSALYSFIPTEQALAWGGLNDEEKDALAKAYVDGKRGIELVGRCGRVPTNYCQKRAVRLGFIIPNSRTAVQEDPEAELKDLLAQKALITAKAENLQANLDGRRIVMEIIDDGWGYAVHGIPGKSAQRYYKANGLVTLQEFLDKNFPTFISNSNAKE